MTGATPAARYRVYRSASAAGPFARVGETTVTGWTDASAAGGYYRVSGVDACGGESAP